MKTILMLGALLGGGYYVAQNGVPNWLREIIQDTKDNARIMALKARMEQIMVEYLSQRHTLQELNQYGPYIEAREAYLNARDGKWDPPTTPDDPPPVLTPPLEPPQSNPPHHRGPFGDLATLKRAMDAAYEKFTRTRSWEDYEAYIAAKEALDTARGR